MCGICGLAHSDRGNVPDSSVLSAMTQSLAHRGPDASGTHTEDFVGLGHRRLAILDIAQAKQPMIHPERPLVLTYNGELYNFREIRRELQSRGAVFQTAGDTEVILHGYAQWGMDGLLNRLVGMFAFALWDTQQATLYLVRDRFGVKPLYWFQDANNSLYFASELRALRCVPSFPNNINTNALLHVLNLGYSVGVDSIYRGVRELAPGNVLTWSPHGTTTTTPYWSLAEVWTRRQYDAYPGDDTCEARFSSLLDQCVGDRLQSEVPLGAFLSGGLDSSLISARILHQKATLKTFSIGFEERGFSELPWAAKVAKELGTDHIEALATCGDPELLCTVARHLDGPFADTSILPTYVLCRTARGHLTVALSGDGGDELLAGYTTHAADRFYKLARTIPPWLRSGAQTLIGGVPEGRGKVGFRFKARQFLAGLHRDPCAAHAGWRMLHTDDSLRDLVQPGLFTEEFDAFAPFRKAYDEVPALNPLDRMLYVDYKTWLAHDILVKVDRASMAHGLEVRSPFLDHRLVEFCAGLPPHLKLRGLRGKHLLRSAAQRQVPGRIIRRKKSGFNAPVSHWIAGPWRELVHDMLLGSGMKDLVRGDTAQKMIDEHQRGQRDHGFRLFALLMVSLWKQHHGAT